MAAAIEDVGRGGRLAPEITDHGERIVSPAGWWKACAHRARERRPGRLGPHGGHHRPDDAVGAPAVGVPTSYEVLGHREDSRS